MNTNIFVVTRLGQLRNVHGLIKQLDLKENVLLIFYTEDNMDNLDSLRKNIYKNDFKKTIYLKLPYRPLSTTLSKCKKIYEDLQRTFTQIMKDREGGNLFLANIDNFYKYFERIAEQKKLKLILFEEGLTTYRVFDPTLSREFTRRDVYSSLKRVLKYAKKTFVAIVMSILYFLSWLTKRNIFDYIKSIRIPKKYRYGHIDHFDEAYVCFPNKLRAMGGEGRIGKIKKLDFFVDSSDIQKLTKDFPENSVLLINQRYIPYDIHFNIIFDILERQGEKNVIIKFHPKEEQKMYAVHLEEAIKKHPKLKVKSLYGYDHVPVENLIPSGKFKRVYSITSSSLLYIKLIDPKMEVISIGKSYKELCLSSKYNVDAGFMNLFNRDYDAFDKLFDLKQV